MATNNVAQPHTLNAQPSNHDELTEPPKKRRKFAATRIAVAEPIQGVNQTINNHQSAEETEMIVQKIKRTNWERPPLQTTGITAEECITFVDHLKSCLSKSFRNSLNIRLDKQFAPNTANAQNHDGEDAKITENDEKSQKETIQQALLFENACDEGIDIEELEPNDEDVTDDIDEENAKPAKKKRNASAQLNGDKNDDILYIESVRAQCQAFETSAAALINERITNRNYQFKKLSTVTIRHCGRSIALLFFFEEKTNFKLDLRSKWTQSKLHDFLSAFTDFLIHDYVAFRLPYSTNRTSLHPNTISTMGARALVALRVLGTVDVQMSMAKTLSNMNTAAYQSLLRENGLDHPIAKEPITMMDADIICSRMPTNTAVDVQHQLLLQLLCTTGLRPCSIVKSEGAASYWAGILIKDIKFLFVDDHFELKIRITHEKPTKDAAFSRTLQPIAERDSPYCMVKLMLIHLAGLNYLTAPIDQVHKLQKVEIKKEAEDMPLFNAYNIYDQTLTPSKMLGSLYPFFQTLAQYARLSKWDISARSCRKGNADALILNFITRGHQFITKDDIIAFLCTSGNWKSREAGKYVSSFMDKGFAVDLMEQLKCSGQVRCRNDIVARYPFATLIQYDYLDDVTDENREFLYANDELLSQLKSERLIARQNKDVKKASKLSDSIEHRTNSLIQFAKDKINQTRYRAAKEMHTKNSMLSIIASQTQTIDLDAAKIALSLFDSDKRQLLRFSPFGKIALIPSSGISCWSCDEQFTSTTDFTTHFLQNHINGKQQLKCKGSSCTFSFDAEDGDRIVKTCKSCRINGEKQIKNCTVCASMSMMKKHFSDHHILYKCERCQAELSSAQRRRNKCGNVKGQHHNCSPLPIDDNFSRIPLKEIRPCTECSDVSAQLQSKVLCVLRHQKIKSAFQRDSITTLIAMRTNFIDEELEPGQIRDILKESLKAILKCTILPKCVEAKIAQAVL